LTVGVLRLEDQDVVLDPIDPPQHICDSAHTSVTGVKANKRRKRLAKAALWVPGLGPPGGPTL
jgi:hypothetical protein